MDSTFIRSRDEGERHLEVHVGNVETVDGGRQVFGAVIRAETDITALIKRTLETVGRTDVTEVTAFTDGCPGLRAVLANAGVTKPSILDWFHIAMRLHHATLAAANLPIDCADRATAKAVIVAEVERLQLAHLEQQSEERPAQHQANPQGHACLQRRHSHGVKGVACVARVACG